MLRKINRRLKKLLKQVIIYNRQYKPKSAYQTIEDYTKATPGARCLEIYPKCISTLSVSDEFKSRFIDYVETTTTAQIPAARVVQIPNGRVHTDNNASVAIISANNKLIGELTFTLGSDEPYDNNIFSQNYFEPPKHYEGVVFTMLIGEGGIVNYAHWLIDSISRIELLKQSGWFDKIDWFLVPSCKYDFQRDSLRMLGIEDSKVIQGEHEPHIQADTIIATTYVRYHEHNPDWSIRFLKEHFLTPETKGLMENKHPYVYISRNDSAKRRVLNEPELMQVLAPYGFVSFELSKLSFKEKISLFYNAEIIIATIGAGQANMAFCHENANVIELMAEDFTQPFFSDLAYKAGVNYDYLICQSDGHAKNFKQGEKLNLIVDIKAVKQKLKAILKQQTSKTA